MSDSVYKVIELVGTSEKSWEEAARTAVEAAGKSLKNLRVAEVNKLDMKVEDGKVTAFRARVGLSFKYGYGKFVFDTTVEGLEPSCSPQADRERGGTIVLAVPQKIEVVQRRSYFRVSVPESLKVEALLWHRSGKLKEKRHLHDAADEMHNCCHGRLDDISAGGAQITVPHENGVPKTNLKKGQFIGVRFTPTPYETPVMFTAQIRNVLPTADGESSSLGLQIVGLEASPEGRQILTRLIHVVEQYYQMNQSGVKQQDMQPVPSAV